MLTVRYFWRELTDEGLLVKIRINYWDTSALGEYGYSSEEEAIQDFEKTIDTTKTYCSNKYVLVKCYGSIPDGD